MLWGIEVEDDGLRIECIDVSHLVSGACRHACLRIADGCSCHSMRNTIEDPCWCCDGYPKSSRSTSCTAAAAPSQDDQLSRLDKVSMDGRSGYRYAC